MQVFLTADANKAYLRTSIALFWVHQAGQVKEEQLSTKMLLAFNLHPGGAGLCR